MIILVDLARNARDILEYIRLHLGEIYGDRLYDGIDYIESEIYIPDQLLIYEVVLNMAMSTTGVSNSLNRGVTDIYVALYSKYPEIGLFKITTMLEDIVDTSAYHDIVNEINKVCSRHNIDPRQPIHHRVHRSKTVLVLETMSGSVA